MSENVFVRTGAGMCHNVVMQLNILPECVSQFSGIPNCAGVCPTIVEKPGARDCAWCDHTDRPRHTTPYRRSYRYTTVQEPQLLTTQSRSYKRHTIACITCMYVSSQFKWAQRNLRNGHIVCSISTQLSKDLGSPGDKPQSWMSHKSTPIRFLVQK